MFKDPLLTKLATAAAPSPGNITTKRTVQCHCHINCPPSLLGLLGICLVQICGYTGINYSSPALASAMGNLLPAFTFLLAIIFRMEKFDLRRPSSQAKSVGTIVAVSGAFVMILYRGPLITTSASNLHHPLLLSQQQSNWVLGGLVLGTACFVTSIWSIAQAATVKEYPDEITVVFFYCFFGSVQCAIFTLIAERNPTVVFSAIQSTVFRSAALTWCLHKKGPVSVAMFKPTQMVIAVVFGLIFLGDALYLGSVIGGTIIAFGFYTMMWGKAKEEDNVCITLESSTTNTPFAIICIVQERGERLLQSLTSSKRVELPTTEDQYPFLPIPPNLSPLTLTHFFSFFFFYHFPFPISIYIYIYILFLFSPTFIFIIIKLSWSNFSFLFLFIYLITPIYRPNFIF